MARSSRDRSIDKITSLHLNNEAQFLCFTLDSPEQMQQYQAGQNQGQNSQTQITEQIYAINVFKVREIIYYDGEITETAGENDGLVLGFLTVRGDSIPLVDMRRWLYYSPREHRDLRPYSIQDSGQNSLVVICNFSNQDVGLKILGVKHIIHRSWGDVNVGSDYGLDSVGKITGTTKYDDGSIIQILDVEKMLVDAFPGIISQNHLEIQGLGTIHSEKIVLIAEDSKSASKALEAVLEKLEVKYISFGNGRALIDYLNMDEIAQRVGAVITDLEMPKVSGFEVLRQIKSHPNTKHIPVIVNSSMGSDSNREMAEKLNADGFITKSNPEEVQEYLRKFLPQEED